jgi:hypothetical protein
MKRPQCASHAKLVSGLSQAGRADLARRSVGAAPAADGFLPPPQHHLRARSLLFTTRLNVKHGGGSRLRFDLYS